MAARRVRLGVEARALLAKVFAAAKQPVWLVGGSIRDAALGRPFGDLDLACADARALAAQLARAFKGTLVTLDEENAVYRLVLMPARGKTIKQIDIAGLQGKTIVSDLARRDFTVNAAALELTKDLPPSLPEAAFLDPRGGLKDLAAGIVRADIEENLDDDPLRLLRAFRIAAQLGLEIEAKTLKAIGRRKKLIAVPAAERVAAELLMLLAVPGVSSWLVRMDECGLLTALFPELEPSRRCAEDYYGPGGVLKHTLEVCARVDFLLTNLRAIYPGIASDLEGHFAARGGPPFRALLLLSALLHDVSKPETAKKIDGRLRFFEHDTRGASATGKILRRLRLSREQIDTASAIVRHHLRPGHLASGGPLTERAAYRFFRDLGPDAPGLLIVCWGDHASYMPVSRLKRLIKVATADSKRSDLSRFKPEDARKTIHHLQLVSALLRRWRDLSRAPAPERLLDGRDIMKALKIPPGPRIGELLERVREAQAEGEVKNRDEALALITRLK
ncbi:MAG: HD domain-containing protein [Elusimicrobia bacterium]|nr:HD domain-containing protein [Elusimicrobiota bacterium]